MPPARNKVAIAILAGGAGVKEVMRLNRALGWAAAVALVVAVGCGPQPVQGRATPVQGGPSETPAPRTDASAAFDATNGTVVMFGGANRTGVLDETWTWDGRWQQQHPADSPPAREFAVMAFDPATRNVILFGGESCPPPQPNDPIGCEYHASPTTLSDTWSWDGVNWSRASTLDAPSGVHWSHEYIAAAADGPRHALILVSSGQQEPDYKVETWTLRGGDWIRLRPAHSPPSMAFGGPAFDAIGQGLMLHQNGAPHVMCGTGQTCHQGPSNAATWFWDGADWHQLDGSIVSPHDDGGLVQSGSEGTLLIGALSMYRWTGKAWTGAQAMPWGEIDRTGWVVAYDQPAHEVVLFGGRAWGTNHLYGDTLGWDGRAWSTLLAAQASPNPGRLAACSANAAVAGIGSGQTDQPDAVAFELDFAEPPSGPCHLDVDVQFTLLNSSGTGLQVKGNPSTVHLGLDLTFDAHVQKTKFTVANACRLDPATVVRYSAGDFHYSEPAVLPSCTTQSTAPITISASLSTGLA